MEQSDRFAAPLESGEVNRAELVRRLEISATFLRERARVHGLRLS